jgi:hypothetical protein
MTMVKKLFPTLALLTALGAVASGQSRIVTTREANGTYRDGPNQIKILALGNNKLRISFELTYEYKTPAGPSANEGVAEGEATIENDIAVFRPPDSNGCTITIKFLKGSRIKVTQAGDPADCGFGNNVRADGTYQKRSSKPPRF